MEKINRIKSLKESYDLIFVGRLNYQKNVELLINSVDLLKKEFPNLKVCIIGAGSEEKQLKTLAYNLGLNNNIKFLGKIEEQNIVFQHMKSSKIFVLPSKFEGFPLVVVEAAGCGLPLVIAEGKWTLKDKFVEGNAIISKANIKDFAKSISYLLKNKNIRDKMTKIGIKKAKELDWDKLAKKTENYYKEVIKK